MTRERSSHEHRRRRDERWDEYEYEYEPDYEQDEEYEEDEEPPRRRNLQRQPYPRSARSSSSSYRSRATRSPYQPSSRTSHARTLRPQPHQRSAWPTLLTGCAIGVVVAVLAVAIIVVSGIYSLQNGKVSIPVISPANRTFLKEETQTVPLSTISQVVVCDVIGNVIVKADSTASKPTVTITKKVQASSQTEADQEFQHMAVAVQPPETVTGPLSCARLQTTATLDNTTLIPTQTSNTSSPATTAAGDTSNTLTTN